MAKAKQRPAKQAARRVRPGVCRVCGCTDGDCSDCVELTGDSCSWVEADLCSACATIGQLETEIEQMLLFGDGREEWRRRLRRVLRLVGIRVPRSLNVAAAAGGKA